MKRRVINILAILGAAIMATGCAKFTELSPKGVNMLGRVSDLDMLLNYEWPNLGEGKHSIITSGNLGYLGNALETLVNAPATSPNTAMCITGDFSLIDMVYDKLTTDSYYTQMYELIGQVANPVIKNADTAEGDRELAKRLKAEALTLRAYLHYLLVKNYAGAYDPATAETQLALAYAFEDNDPSQTPVQLTMKKFYENILADIADAKELNALQAPSNNRMRMNSAALYAVEALVNMEVRNYSAAKTAAAASIGIEPTVDDYNQMLVYRPDMWTDEVDAMKVYPGWELRRDKTTGMVTKEDLFKTDYLYFFWYSAYPFLLEEVDGDKNILLNHISYSHAPDYSGTMYGRLYMGDFFFPNGNGLSTVDMYFVLAECAIREKQWTTAADNINYILSRRQPNKEIYEAAIAQDPTAMGVIAPENYYKPVSFNNEADAIKELRKVVWAEHWFRSGFFYWQKRWNAESAWAYTINKEFTYATTDESGNYVAGKTVNFPLTPDSKVWIRPFPQKTMNLTDFVQNYE